MASHEPKIEDKSVAPSQPSVHRTTHRIVVGFLAVILGIPLLGALATIAYIVRFQNHVYPGVFIGEYSLGGMSRGEVKNFLHSYEEFLATSGFAITLSTASGTEQFKIPLPQTDATSSPVSIDDDATLERVFAIGRPKQWIASVVEPWKLLVRYQTTTVAFALQEEYVVQNMKPTVAPFEREPKNAAVTIRTISPLDYHIEPEQIGFLINYQEFFEALRARVSVLSRTGIRARVSSVQPDITRTEIDQFVKKIPSIIGQGAITLTYPNVPKPKGGEYTWVITEEQLADWLRVDENSEGETIAQLDGRSVGDYINAIIRPDVDQDARDAKFTVENNRVKEFEPGQGGLSLDVTSTVEKIQTVVAERSVGFTTTTAVSIVVAHVSSTRSLGDLNTLGIVDIIGVGSSTFKDSHSNRIKNIANAVKRLNGVLIAPGEEFSTNKYAGPYIESNGFLPEMVIKGDKITPEVGGGMCQIGTTLFRMAMNSGMPITQRQNHSLVVSYYADPVNNNPGTDATLYEPHLDLKFVNDTGNYLLLTTEIDYKRQQLTFILWGKSDGRSGSYTHPIVKRWISPGAPKEIVSASAPIGSRSCQNAFRGAEATFTYTRFTSTSQKIEQVFDSYYRPLSKICIVGPTSTPAAVPASVLADAPNPVDPVIDTVVPAGN